MFFTIDPNNHEPIFLQIVNGITFAILSGVWRAGDRIPSRRDLAERLRVNPNTVAAAYRELETMGVVEVRRGLGRFVTEGAMRIARTHRGEILRKRFADLIAAGRAANLTEREIHTMFEQALSKRDAPPIADDEAKEDTP